MKLLRRNKRKDRLIIAGAIVVAAVLVYLVAFAHNSGNSARTVNPSPQQTQQQAQSAAQNSGSSTQKTSSIGTSIQGNSTPGSGSGSGSSGPAPDTPTGQWISNHNAATTDTENSECISTSGATCQITFTMGSTVKSLPAQPIPSGGTNTTWYWNVGSYLTSGTWKVTIRATLNGKSTTATDSQNLVVQ